MMNAKRVKVIVIGSSGLIGREVLRQLAAGSRSRRYEPLGVTRHTSPAVYLRASESIERFFARVGDVDHVIVTAGDARFAELQALDDAALEVGVRSKLLGQVNVALAALRRLPPGGSVTLTSGELSHAPIPGSAAVALANGAIDAFVRAAALDVPEGRRINVVSPGWLQETLKSLGRDPSSGVPTSEVAALYLHAIESQLHGQVLTHDLSKEVRHAS